MEISLPWYLQTETSELLRVLHYCQDRIIQINPKGWMIRDNDGWLRVLTEKSKEQLATILVVTAQNKMFAEISSLLGVDPHLKDEYNSYVEKCLTVKETKKGRKLFTNNLIERLDKSRYAPKGTPLKLHIEEVADIHLPKSLVAMHLLPLPNGEVLDLNGNNIEYKRYEDLKIDAIYHKDILPERPNFELLNAVKNGEREDLRETWDRFIEQYTPEVIARLGRLTYLPPEKNIDFIAAPQSNYGKSTLIELDQRSGGEGLVSSHDTKSAMDRMNTKFARIARSMTETNIVFFDECHDITDKSGKPKPLNGSHFNGLVAQRFDREEKYYEPESLPRTANPVFIGNDFPYVDTEKDGVKNRLQTCLLYTSPSPRD